MQAKDKSKLYDAFISFSSRDTELAEQIVKKLEEEGIKCFISSRNIKSAEDWAEKVVEALDGSRMVIYLHTKNSNESLQISREVQRAIDLHQMPFVTYRLTDEEFKGSKAFFIQSLNWIDSLVDPFENIGLLVQAVKDIRDGKSIKTFEQDINHWTLWIRKHIKLIIAVIALLVVSAAVYFVISASREKKAAEARQSHDIYQELLYRLENTDVEKEPAVVFDMLDDVDSIASAYRNTEFVSDFEFDTDGRRAQIRHHLDSTSNALVKVIQSYYEGYLAAPVESLKRPVIESIEKLLSIDAAIGKQTDEAVLRIKEIIQ